MENKMIYIAQRWDKAQTCDLFDIAITYSIDEARAACVTEWHHLTRRERAKAYLYIIGFAVDVIPGETAKDAWKRHLEQDDIPGDPEYYEEYNEADDDQGEQATAEREV